MTEGSPPIGPTDPCNMDPGTVEIFCKACNKITKQKYLGLESSSRKVASRCLECKNTNFQEEDPERWRNRNKKNAKSPLKEIEEEKSKIFGPPSEQNPSIDQDNEKCEPSNGAEY